MRPALLSFSPFLPRFKRWCAAFAGKFRSPLPVFLITPIGVDTRARKITPNSAAATPESAPGSLPDGVVLQHELLQRVQQVIQAHLDDCELSVTTLCRQAGTSRTPLHNTIKALTGKSTTEYIRYIRLTKARELLLTTNLSVREIAYRTGFRSHNYFTKMFRELFVLTPREYRLIHNLSKST